MAISFVYVKYVHESSGGAFSPAGARVRLLAASSVLLIQGSCGLGWGRFVAAQAGGGASRIRRRAFKEPCISYAGRRLSLRLQSERR